MIELNQGKPPMKNSHVETKHYSSILLEGTSKTIYCETISLKRRPKRDLNHSAVIIKSTRTKDLTQARIAQSHLLIGLEEKVKTGKTARQALIDTTKLTPEQEEELKRRFDALMRYMRGK